MPSVGANYHLCVSLLLCVQKKELQPHLPHWYPLTAVPNTAKKLYTAKRPKVFKRKFSFWHCNYNSINLKILKGATSHCLRFFLPPEMLRLSRKIYYESYCDESRLSSFDFYFFFFNLKKYIYPSRIYLWS